MERKECMVCNYRKGDVGESCPQCGSSHYRTRAERSEYDRMLFAVSSFRYAHIAAVKAGKPDPELLFNRLNEILAKGAAIIVKAMESEYGRGTPLQEVEYTYTSGKVVGDYGGHFEKTSPSCSFFYRSRKGRVKERIELLPAFLVFHLLEKYPHGFEVFEAVEKEVKKNE